MLAGGSAKYTETKTRSISCAQILQKTVVVEYDRPPLIFCRLPCGSPSLRSQALFSTSAATREEEPARATLSSVDANMIGHIIVGESQVVVLSVQNQDMSSVKSSEHDVYLTFISRSL